MTIERDTARRRALLALLEQALADEETLSESIDRRTAELLVLHETRATIHAQLADLAARLGQPRRR